VKKIHFKTQAELVAALASSAFQGRALHMVILHDDACTPDRCSCEPEYVLEDLTVENYIAGQRAQAEWKRNSVS
jgi:hypothetical protein